METPIKVVLFNSLDDIRKFNALVNESNYKLAIARLKLEKWKIINCLKDLKAGGVIKSIFKPRNKNYQDILNILVESKRTIKESINKMKTIYG